MTETEKTSKSKKRKRNEKANSSKGKRTRKFYAKLAKAKKNEPIHPVLDVSRDNATDDRYKWMTTLSEQHSTTVNDITSCQAFFGYGINKRIASLIQNTEWTKITGSVAWITDPFLLKALVKRDIPTQFIVQKEKFIRIKKGKLRERYGKLKWNMTLKESCESVLRKENGLMLFPLPEAWSADVTNKKEEEEKKKKKERKLYKQPLEAIRCAGNYHGGLDRVRHGNLMHHKFVVFHDKEGPAMVIMGSYNWSANAAVSREDIIVISSRKLAFQYALEHLNLLVHSEPLDWKETLSTSVFHVS